MITLKEKVGEKNEYSQLFLPGFGDPEIFPSKTNLQQNIKLQIFSPFSLWLIPAILLEF